MLKQTMMSNKASPLLQYAGQKLNPAIFSHPIWVRFGRQNLNILPRVINDLLSAAENLRYQDPGEACQVLFLCAVCQNYSSQRTKALSTIRGIISLAEREGLVQEVLWAKWGACAIRAQQGNLEKAAAYLTEIKYLLSKQNEWMLIDFVDIVRQALLHPLSQEDSRTPDLLPIPAAENLTTHAVELLDQWGLTATLALQDIDEYSHAPATNAFLSLHHWQSRWQSLILRFKGELKLSWGESNTMDNPRQVSFSRSIAGFLHFRILHHNIDTQSLKVEIPSRVTSFDNIPSINRSIDVQISPAPEQEELNLRESHGSANLPISIHMLGSFSLAVQGAVLIFPASRSLSVLKYLLLHHKQNITREVLMEVFWPEADPEKARNNLNVAIHRIRQHFQTVTTVPILHYQDGMHGIESNIHIWLDIEEFENLVKTGQRLEARHQLTDAITTYEAAISLYQGDFLQENSYEEWTILPREHLRVAYLDILERLCQIYFNQERYAACITACQRILFYDQCREDAYCLLMQCYSRQGLDLLALRQYQNCIKALRAELEVDPSPEITKVYNRIRRHERV